LVPETKVAGRALPFHSTDEDGKKFVPVTVRVNDPPPAMAELGLSSVMAGRGTCSVKVAALEAPPPGAGVETVTIAVPGVAMSAAVIAACKLVLETKVVVRALPFHWTVDEEIKLEPVTVNVNPAVPETTAFGFKEVTTGAGLPTLKVNALEVPPLGAGVETVTIAVLAVAMSAALIAACKLVLETKVVVRALPFHWTVEEEIKLEPVTVSVNAAPPAVAELGFSDPDASEGVGLPGGGLPEPPPHPVIHATKIANSRGPRTPRFKIERSERKNVASTGTYQGPRSVFIASPPEGWTHWL